MGLVVDSAQGSHTLLLPPVVAAGDSSMEVEVDLSQ